MNIKRKNNLWDLILNQSIDLDNIALDSFREINAQNNRFATWSAIEPSSRYFKSLLYAHAENLDRRILQSKLSLNLESKDKKNGNGIKHYLKKIRNQNFAKLIQKNFKEKLKVEWYGSKDTRSYFVSFDKIYKIGFRGKFKPIDGIKEIISKLDKNLIDLDPKTITLNWYETLEKWKIELDKVLINNKLIKF